MVQKRSGIVAYIPAKGRSRGLPNKNLALLDGKPLVEHTIRFAIKSAAFDKIFVSTESKEIAALASACGVSVLDRPPQLAEDSVRIAEVLLHDLAAMEAQAGTAFELLACLLPTSPLRRESDLDKAIALAVANPDAPSVVSVGRLPCPLGQVVSLDGSPGRLRPLSSIENLTVHSQRQSHAELYYPNGAIAIARLSFFRKDPLFYVEGQSIGLPIDSISGLDIDTPDDLELVRTIVRGAPSRS